MAEKNNHILVNFANSVLAGTVAIAIFLCITAWFVPALDNTTGAPTQTLQQGTSMGDFVFWFGDLGHTVGIIIIAGALAAIVNIPVAVIDAVKREMAAEKKKPHTINSHHDIADALVCPICNKDKAPTTAYVAKCPKCGKLTIIKSGTGIECSNCGFPRHDNTPAKAKATPVAGPDEIVVEVQKKKCTFCGRLSDMTAVTCSNEACMATLHDEPGSVITVREVRKKIPEYMRTMEEPVTTTPSAEPAMDDDKVASLGPGTPEDAAERYKQRMKSRRMSRY